MVPPLPSRSRQRLRSSLMFIPAMRASSASRSIAAGFLAGCFGEFAARMCQAATRARTDLMR
jgi:hypothetical protein